MSSYNRWNVASVFKDNAHPKILDARLIAPMFAALGECVSGQGINAVEDWWLEKIKHDISYQRFTVQGPHAIQYENQFMVKHYFDSVYARLPTLTGTIDNTYEHFRPYPQCEFQHWWDIQVQEVIGGSWNTEIEYWRSLRTPEEREANKHPNRSNRWVPNRLEEIRKKRIFYFAKPNWKEEDKAETPLPTERRGGDIPFEYLSPFTFSIDSDRSNKHRVVSPKRNPNTAFEIRLRNPTTNAVLPFLLHGEQDPNSEVAKRTNATKQIYLRSVLGEISDEEWRDYRENMTKEGILVSKGYEKMDLEADAYVEILSKFHLERLHWFVRVTKAYINEDVRHGDDDYGQLEALQMDFMVADIQKMVSGEDEGGRLFPYSFQFFPHLKWSQFEDVYTGVNYYAPKQSRLGIMNWIKL